MDSPGKLKRRILAYLDERIECLKEMLGKLEGIDRGAAIDITYMRGKRDELQRMKLAIERGTLEANKDV